MAKAARNHENERQYIFLQRDMKHERQPTRQGTGEEVHT